MEKIRTYDQRWTEMETERASWVPHWEQLSKFLLPRSGRFFITDRNRGEPRHNNIIDSTGTRALRTLAAGMMSGMTSPARPWFRLATPDPELNQSAPVKVWLADVTRLMAMVFAKSNTYRALHTTYEELGTFGTAAKIVLSDYDSIIHHYPLTAGEYCIATDYKGNVNTLYRRFEKTVAELVAEFGIDRCSQQVQSLYHQNSLGTWIQVAHAIEPRSDRDPSKRDARNMAWKSVYYEVGQSDKQVLRESGFKQFPALVSRWATSGGDIYGNSPGMEVLGDVKQLQHQQLRKGQGIDYQTKPPLQVPTSMKNREQDFMPGGISYYDAQSAQAGVRSAFEVNLNLQHLAEDMEEVRGRIRGGFFADLFLMLSNIDHTGMTATEIAERHEEKLLMLGPTVERLHNEELNPLIEMTFEYMVRAGILPPPPEELQGVDLQVEFISVLAQAQRAVGTNSVDRFVGNLGAIAAIKPEVLDKFDADEWADVYSDMLGVEPTLIVPDDQVALIRKQRAQQQQAAQQAAMMNSAADTANKLGATPTAGSNALTDIASAVATAQGL
ncbi:portal protein [Comamonas sp. C24C]